MDASIRVWLEVGSKQTFAGALDWPGWCRSGRRPDDALDALEAYRVRYTAIAGTRLPAGPLQVVGQVDGGATTDFGAPGVPGPWDDEPLTAQDASTAVDLLEAAWEAFDAEVASAPAELAKGPRGGGRDRDAIVEHVREAERSYARKIGVAVRPRTPWSEQRQAVGSALRAGGGGAWTARYFLRRTAWHVTDHLWEIQDRRTPRRP